jgi:hypothetical protein
MAHQVQVKPQQRKTTEDAPEAQPQDLRSEALDASTTGVLETVDEALRAGDAELTLEDAQRAWRSASSYDDVVAWYEKFPGFYVSCSGSVREA